MTTSYNEYPSMPMVTPAMALLWTEAGNQLGRLDSEEAALTTQDAAQRATMAANVAAVEKESSTDDYGTTPAAAMALLKSVPAKGVN